MSDSDTSLAFSLDSEDKLAHFRDRFVVKDSELIYLDGNSLGRLPRACINLMQRVVEDEWGGRLIRGWGEGWFELQERIGGKIAKIIGAEADEVVVADSTSVNLFKLAMAAMQAQKKENRTRIITDDLNFPSDVYIFQGVAETIPGSRVELVPSADGLTGPEEQLAAALDEHAGLLSLTHTLYKSGYIYNMEDLTAKAHAAGALTLWDLSHSVGSVPVYLNQSKADLAVGCSYKYLNGGPGAPAFLYVSRALQSKLRNPISGWFGQKDMFKFDLDYEPEPNIRRFLAGTPTMLSLAAIEPGIDMILEAGIEEIRKKSISQTNYFIALYDRHLAQLGFRLNSPRDPELRGSHVSLGHDEAWRINQALIKDVNVLPDFREPDNIRFGIAPLYTSYADIQTAIMRIRRVVSDKLYEKYSNDKSTVT